MAQVTSPGGRRPLAGPGAGIYRIKDSHFSLPGRPPGEVLRIDGVVLGGLGVIFRGLDVKLAFAADAVLQVPHFRLGVGLHRLPLALRPLGGLPGLFAGRLPMGSDI